MTDYSLLTYDIEFDLVRELAQNDGVGHILTIPGVWEFVREHYNNDMLDLYERRFLRSE